jgi:hypothetical protein
MDNTPFTINLGNTGRTLYIKWVIYLSAWF